MARMLFGGSSDDYAVGSDGKPVTNRRVRFYTSAAMTTEITDLASDAAGTGTPLAVFTNTAGFWGPVYGPDGVTVMYAGTLDAQSNPPTYVVAVYAHYVSEVASFNGRTGAVTLAKGDVTGTGLAAGDVGADASGAAASVQTNLTAEVTRAQAAEAALSSGMIFKAAAAVATTNQTLSGLPTVDGVTLTAGQVILLTGQTSGSQNGLWSVASGAWTRPSNFAAGLDATATSVLVESGTTGAGTTYAVTGTTNNVVGTNVLTFVKTSGSGASVAGLAEGTTVTASGNLTVGVINPINTTSAVVVGTLPAGTNVGDMIGVRWKTGSTNAASITGTISGGTNSILLIPGELLAFRWDGSSWWSQAGNKPLASLDSRYPVYGTSTAPSKPRTGRISDIVLPGTIFHQGVGRLGGLVGTMDSYRVSQVMGSAMIDLDLHRLKDGTWVVYHDSVTVGTTTSTLDSTTIQGNTDDQTSVSVTRARMDGTKFWSTYPKDFRLPTLTEVLNEFGGVHPLQAEMKNGNGTALARLIKARGLEDCILLSSATLSDLSAVRAVSSTIQTGLIANVAPGSFTTTPSQAAAAGVTWFFPRVDGVSGVAWTASDLAPWLTAGFKIMPYNVYRHVDYDAWIAAGCVGVYAEDPYVLYGRPVATTDPFPSQLPYFGQQRTYPWVDGGGQETVAGANYRGVFGTSPYRLRLPNHAGINDFILQGWASPIGTRSGSPPTTYSITATFMFETLPSDVTRWLAIDFAAPTDQSNPTDLGAYNGYRAYLRANGSVNIVKRVAGADSGSTITATSTSVSAGTTGVIVRIDVTPTTVKVTRTDTGVNVTLSDSSYRGGYFWLGKNEGGGAGFDGAFGIVSVA